jgi:hypothetical protein
MTVRTAKQISTASLGIPPKSESARFSCSSLAVRLPTSFQGGAIAMVFTGSDVQHIPDGQGGTYVIGTFDLDIPEATGVYKSFVGGHNKMVDVLHLFADGTRFEHCICIISRKVWGRDRYGPLP